jgi:hypothetical protein
MQLAVLDFQPGGAAATTRCRYAATAAGGNGVFKSVLSLGAVSAVRCTLSLLVFVTSHALSLTQSSL